MGRDEPEVHADSPTAAERLARPIRRFLQVEAAAGILLIVATAVALIWANSPAQFTYFKLAGGVVTVGLGHMVLAQPVLFWVNDLLMAVFFLVVGLEIKREILAGQLSSPRKAALPIVAAIGGMLVPAGLYALVAGRTVEAGGWGIPMATDIAFALGALTLLGARVPPGLKVFLTALAIADDLGAVLVIAVFYSGALHAGAVAAGAVILAALVLANLAGVRSPLVYGALGIALWLAVLGTGVHPTVAGVLLAMTLPARSRIDGEAFLARSRSFLDAFDRARRTGGSVLTSAEQQEALDAVADACEEVAPPLQRFEHALHPWVMYLVMPVFAFFNAAVVLHGGAGATLAHPAPLGIVLGLVAGKPIGIVLFSWLAVATGLAVLPERVRFWQLVGTGFLGGIGFTMSLFIAGLAFEGEALDAAKVGILTASAVAGVVGTAILAFATAERAAGAGPSR